MKKYFNIYYWIRKLLVSSLFSKFFSHKLLNKLVFKAIYKSNHWNKSRKFNNIQSYSGPGSIPNSFTTINLIKNLKKFFEEKNIQSVLDAPCGDCAWIKSLFDLDIKYTGIDIVKDLIILNQKNFSSNSNIKFYCKDISLIKNFKDYDFILMRDFFIHLPITQIQNILLNLKNSNCKFFAFNSYENNVINKEITTGKHRKINLLKEPFNLSAPFYKFQEFNDQKLPNEDNFLYIYKNQ
jgi:hypothetical protein